MHWLCIRHFCWRFSHRSGCAHDLCLGCLGGCCRCLGGCRCGFGHISRSRCTFWSRSSGRGWCRRLDQCHRSNPREIHGNLCRAQWSLVISQFIGGHGIKCPHDNEQTDTTNDDLAAIHIPQHGSRLRESGHDFTHRINPLVQRLFSIWDDCLSTARLPEGAHWFKREFGRIGVRQCVADSFREIS